MMSSSVNAHALHDEHLPLRPEKKEGNKLGIKYRAIMAEFLGTLFFVFFGVTSVVVSSKFGFSDQPALGVLLVAFAEGLGLLVSLFSILNVSPSHLNPAVTLASVIVQKETFVNGVAIIIGQVAGGIAAAALVLGIFDDANEPKNGRLGAFTLDESLTAGQGFLLESILSFMYVFVVASGQFNPVKDPNDTSLGTSMCPRIVTFAVGFTMLVGSLVGGFVGSGCMNPARALGPAIITNHWKKAYVFVLGPFVGGTMGALTWETIFSPRFSM
eukprot:TRINITY_DN81649_c0_g1_i1.p1 TRINITY_DN81649_c0_g1~~TRINITY_DN81649_c0_g1_i1.p1  ORF type:complete len:271 (+),score=61.74 TRINITY_DN81649_c0_g1_i1:223-1035(+)